MRNIFKIIIIFLIIKAVTADYYVYAADHTLNVDVYTWDDETPDNPYDTESASILFPGFESATIEEPWKISSQFIRVQYSCSEASWGIRIVTNNERDIRQIYPKPLNQGTDGRWEWELHPEWGGRYYYVEGHWDGDVWIEPYYNTGNNDSVSYGGLIDPATRSNPNFRANLAWQVFKDPVFEPDPIYYASWGSWYGYWNVGSNPVERRGVWRYPYDWAYVVDKSNKWNGESALGGVYYPSPPAPEWSAKYEMIIVGNPLISYLTQYPPMQQTNPDIRPGDCDIAVYLAACFGIMENNQCRWVLPNGNYRTRLYIELIHE